MISTYLGTGAALPQVCRLAAEKYRLIKENNVLAKEYAHLSLKLVEQSKSYPP
tara:strand:- start:400 stop:558 length:159 start_codon:yes stop_codon:yes gene_type:complete